MSKETKVLVIEDWGLLRTGIGTKLLGCPEMTARFEDIMSLLGDHELKNVTQFEGKIEQAFGKVGIFSEDGKFLFGQSELTFEQGDKLLVLVARKEGQDKPPKLESPDER